MKWIVVKEETDGNKRKMKKKGMGIAKEEMVTNNRGNPEKIIAFAIFLRLI